MLQLVISGRLGRDVQLRRTQNNDAVLNFTVASDVGYGDKKSTVWVDCTVWGKRAEALEQYLHKGDPVTVIGEGNIRTWEKDGKSGAAMTCRVSEIAMQGGKRQDAGNSSGDNAPGGDELDSEIPF